MFYAACKDLEIKKWIVLEFSDKEEQRAFIAGKGLTKRFFSRHTLSKELAIGVLAREDRHIIKYNGYNLNVLGLTL